MKNRLLHLFLTAALLCTATIASGQGKVYTRKVRLADFTDKTTWVVLSGDSMLELTLREAVGRHWRLSPHDFCTPEDYDKFSRSNDNYILRLARDEDVAFLVLSKGGEETEANNLKAPFEVVRLPIASGDDPDGRELSYMGAYLDIIQEFVRDAMKSDRTAYRGLADLGPRKLDGKHIYLDPAEAESRFLQREAGALSGVVVAPARPGKDAHCYKMLIAADTHELYHFERVRCKTDADTVFTDADAKSFERRNAVVVR